MTKSDLEAYLSAFQSIFAIHLKQNVKMKINAFPYNDGAVIIARFSEGSGGVYEIRSESGTLCDALNRTGLISIQKRDYSVNKKKLLLGKKSFILIIPDACFNQSALGDVKFIIDSIGKTKQ